MKPAGGGGPVSRHATRALLALAASGAALAVAGGASAGSPSAGALLRPDLVVLKPNGLLLEQDGGRRQLRFAGRMGNLGPGPLEVKPSRYESAACGGKAVEGRDAFQTIFRDANGDGVFRRRVDTDARRRSVGCIRLHPEHDHWHLDDFAKYELREEASGAAVARSSKVSFCLLDSIHAFPLRPGSAPIAYYQGCSNTAAQGISVGWSDIYSSGLPGQSLDVTGLPGGMYCLEVTADPRDRLREADEENNVTGVRIRLRKGSVERTFEPCRS